MTDFLTLPAVHLHDGDHVSAPTVRGNVALFDVLGVRLVGNVVHFTAAVERNGVRTARTVGRDTEVRVLREAVR